MGIQLPPRINTAVLVRHAERHEGANQL